jgi:hypothetical protein
MRKSKNILTEHEMELVQLLMVDSQTARLPTPEKTLESATKAFMQIGTSRPLRYSLYIISPNLKFVKYNTGMKDFIRLAL